MYQLGCGSYFTRALDSLAIDKPAPLTILVLCQGNICRSAYAEAKLQQLLKGRHCSNVSVKSAGVATADGKSADAAAVQAAALRGIDLSGHRTTRVTAELLAGADLVLLMDPYQRDAIRVLSPGALKKTMYLGALSAGDGFGLTIADPFGREPECFRKCFERIDFAMERLAEHLYG
ncbi:MAG TPA: low molecular weight phosphotyrosine protein phosphatase [Oligoflexia bacterium]|nr:low molecular weight phosphotyrosine protein phosphatase [Oligoflexia bacterium]